MHNNEKEERENATKKGASQKLFRYRDVLNYRTSSFPSLVRWIRI